MIPEKVNRELSDAQKAAELLKTEIKNPIKSLVLILLFRDLPNEAVVYITTTNTRTMEILSEDEAFEKAGRHEDFQKAESHFFGKDPDRCESHLFEIEERQKFCESAKKAVEERGKLDHPNSQYILRVIEELSKRESKMLEAAN